MTSLFCAYILGGQALGNLQWEEAGICGPGGKVLWDILSSLWLGPGVYGDATALEVMRGRIPKFADDSHRS